MSKDKLRVGGVDPAKPLLAHEGRNPPMELRSDFAVLHPHRRYRSEFAADQLEALVVGAERFVLRDRHPAGRNHGAPPCRLVPEPPTTPPPPPMPTAPSTRPP